LGILTYVAYVVYAVAALLMIGAILLQEGKGGGLSALGGTQAESAFGASNPVRRMTVVLAIVFFVLAGFLSWASKRKGVGVGGPEEKEQKEEAPAEGGAGTEEPEEGEAGAEEAAPEGPGGEEAPSRAGGGGDAPRDRTGVRGGEADRGAAEGPEAGAGEKAPE
jgi:protein translocase SecG subunit